MLVSTADEGTSCYICSSCKNPTDQYRKKCMKQPKKLPTVGVYLTPKELEEQLVQLKMLENMADEGEKFLEVRIEGRIGYHDLERIKALIPPTNLNLKS